MRQEILIVDPFPGIWRHSSMLSSIASHLVDIGFNVTVLNCDSKAQKFCSYYLFRNKSSSFSISQSDCCKECLARNEGRKVVLLSDALEFKNLNLYDDLPRELLDLNQDKSFSEWTWRDLPVGRYCAYDMGLEFKTNPAEAITRNQSRFVSDLKNSIVILESVISFVQNKQPVAVIFHNGLYSANRPSWEWLRERNILALDVRNSTNEKHRDTRYHVTQTLAPIFNNEFGNTWDQVKANRLNENESNEVFDFINSAIDGRSFLSYSAPLSNLSASKRDTDILEKNESRTLRVLVVFNSMDERSTTQFCLINESEVFANIDDLVKLSLEVAKLCPSVDFSFRMHPRMSGDHRNPQRSPDLKKIEDLLSNSPPNVQVVIPTITTVSIYDQAKRSDMVISFGSSAGVILSALGFEVVLGEENYDWGNPKEIYTKTFKNGDVDGLSNYISQRHSILNLGTRRLKTQNFAFRYINFSLFIMTSNAGLKLDIFTEENLKPNKLRKFLRIFTIIIKTGIFYDSMKKTSLSLFFAKINLDWLKIYFHTIYELLMRREKSKSKFWSLLIRDPLHECNNLLLKEYLSLRENIDEIIHEERLIKRVDNLIKSE